MNGAVERCERSPAPHHDPAVGGRTAMADQQSTTRDLSGRRFYWVTIIGRAQRRSKKAAYWICRCDCGKTFEASTTNLTHGRQKSCGCYRAFSMSLRQKVHGHAATTGRGQTPEYDAWSAMVRRCYDPKTTQFPNYGGRGIRVCDEWRHDFSAFLAYLGPRPSPRHSLDRINNDGYYEPGNVRWATLKEQGNNTRRNRLVAFQGREQSVTQWAEEYGRSPQLVFNRLALGWSIERALTTPARAKR